MRKFELLNWLHEEKREWEAFLNQIDPEHIELPGVAGHWSIKDIIAHLNIWNLWLLARIKAAQRSMPQPSPPWPAHLQKEDEINAWIYERNHLRPVEEVLDESKQVLQQLLMVIDSLTDNVRIEVIKEHHDFYLVWVGNERFLAGEYFDHFHDDHEREIRAWLARIKN